MVTNSNNMFDGSHKARTATTDRSIPTDSRTIFLDKLLTLESEVRQLNDEREINVHMCNSTRSVLPFKQAFYGTVEPGRNRFRLNTASSIPAVDRDAPFTHWLERSINRLIDQTSGLQQLSYTVPQFCDNNDHENTAYLYKEFLWTPQILNKKLVGGFIVAREAPWHETEHALANRLSELYLHATAATKGRQIFASKKRINKSAFLGASLLVLTALAFIPVPITALAPVEVTPVDPYIVTAPFDGVVREIIPSQGQRVSAGELAIVFDDVHLMNNKRLSEQRTIVAQAEYQKITQGAIADVRVKRDIEVAKASYELAELENQYANLLYDQSKLSVPNDGIAIFSGKQDWEGKPVSAGQAILSVANPSNVNLTISLPVKDSMVIEPGAKVRVFLDSDPLSPLDAVLTSADYNTTADKRDVLSYELQASFEDSDEPTPRIGVQGTALVYGEPATLGYTILRRPISALRQLTGW